MEGFAHSFLFSLLACVFSLVSSRVCSFSFVAGGEHVWCGRPGHGPRCRADCATAGTPQRPLPCPFGTPRPLECPPSNRRVTAEHTTSTLVPASTPFWRAHRARRSTVCFRYPSLESFWSVRAKTFESDPACNLVFSLTHCFCFGYAGHPG